MVILAISLIILLAIAVSSVLILFILKMIRGQWRSRVDVPEFTRCCLCLPLRPGLLVWGYLKMIGLLFFSYIMIDDLIQIINLGMYDVPAMMVVFICLLLIDIIFNILFVVAGHMKHQELFKVYYYYSLGFLAVFVIGYLVVLGSFFYSFRNRPAYMYLSLTLETLYIAVPVVMVQTYVTLLVRSEAQKLDNSSNFQFVNTAAEADQSMVNHAQNAVQP